ncbi:hypothetical protein [Photobacterium leiognathi]|uniref:hypothetical protein n=1 Tax=Photobacterium leiognathi TaxID=553611 RepID=UPI000B26ED6D|nr:hypothetical protein [Photobacterium leiognathi]
MRNLADFIHHMEGGDQNFTIWVHDSNKRYKKLLVSDCKSINLNDFLENQLNVIVEITALDGSNQAYLLLPEINAASITEKSFLISMLKQLNYGKGKLEQLRNTTARLSLFFPLKTDPRICFFCLHEDNIHFLLGDIIRIIIYLLIIL